MVNNSGRLDVLVKGLVEKLVTTSNNPVAQAMYPAYKEGIDGLIEEYLAPRTRTGRIIRAETGTVTKPVSKPKRAKRSSQASKTVSNNVSGNDGGTDNYTVIDV